MIQKIYEVDPLICPKLSGAMRILAFIEDQEVMEEDPKPSGAVETNAKGSTHSTVPGHCLGYQPVPGPCLGRRPQPAPGLPHRLVCIAREVPLSLAGGSYVQKRRPMPSLTPANP